MSQENVEVAQRAFESWNAGDMDTFRELLDAGVVLQNPEGWPEPGPFVGREAVMRQYRQAREIWDSDAMETSGDVIDTRPPRAALRGGGVRAVLTSGA